MSGGDDGGSLGLVLLALVAAVLVVFVAVAACEYFSRTLVSDNESASPLNAMKRVLFPSHSLAVRTPLSLDDATRRLDEHLVRFGVPLLMPTRLVGRVRNGQFRLRLHRTFSGYFSSAVLTGSLQRSRKEDATLLVGDLRPPWLVSAFLAFWLGAVGLFCLFMVPTGVIGFASGAPESWTFVLVPPFMLVCGFMLALGINRQLFRDREELARRLADAVHGTVISGDSDA